MSTKDDDTSRAGDVVRPPQLKDPSSQEELPGASSIEDGRGRDHRCLKVLVAEDDAINWLYLQSLLQNMGHSATGVANGKDAIERWKSDAYDLILMDLQMPVLNGMEVLHYIRTHERDRRTPVIAVTAFASEGDIDGLLAQGFDGEVSKPFNVDELTEEIERVLRALP